MSLFRKLVNFFYPPKKIVVSPLPPSGKQSPPEVTKLRCRPGDVCMIIRGIRPLTEEDSILLPKVLGRVIRVTNLFRVMKATWELEHPITLPECTIYAIDDAYLLPLPGLDISKEVTHDEELRVE